MTDILSGFILIILIGTLASNWRRDDTDGKRRSGLIVYTDAKTRVQYVGTMFGGITVRVDAEGRPVLAK